MSKEKKDLKANYDHPDLSVVFNDKWGDDHNKHCTVRHYQSSMEYDTLNPSSVVAYEDNEVKGELIDDGNGVEVMGHYYDYSEYQTLVMLILANEKAEPWLLKTTKFRLNNANTSP